MENWIDLERPILLFHPRIIITIKRKREEISWRGMFFLKSMNKVSVLLLKINRVPLLAMDMIGLSIVSIRCFLGLRRCWTLRRIARVTTSTIPSSTSSSRNCAKMNLLNLSPLPTMKRKRYRKSWKKKKERNSKTKIRNNLHGSNKTKIILLAEFSKIGWRRWRNW